MLVGRSLTSFRTFLFSRYAPLTELIVLTLPSCGQQFWSLWQSKDFSRQRVSQLVLVQDCRDFCLTATQVKHCKRLIGYYRRRSSLETNQCVQQTHLHHFKAKPYCQSRPTHKKLRWSESMPTPHLLFFRIGLYEKGLENQEKMDHFSHYCWVIFKLNGIIQSHDISESVYWILLPHRWFEYDIKIFFSPEV